MRVLRKGRRQVDWRGSGWVRRTAAWTAQRWVVAAVMWAVKRAVPMEWSLAVLLAVLLAVQREHQTVGQTVDRKERQMELPLVVSRVCWMAGLWGTLLAATMAALKDLWKAGVTAERMGWSMAGM